MTNTATATRTAEIAMDVIIDAWHADGCTCEIEDFPGYVAARSAYGIEAFGRDPWA